MEDARLNRLFDYTKFHIGLYTTAAGALLAAYASKDLEIFQKTLQLHPVLVEISILSMLAAGLAGGIVASSCTIFESFDRLWSSKVGPFGLKWLTGETWAKIEHTAFWISAGAITWAFISN
jgi:hypothetical protein